MQDAIKFAIGIIFLVLGVPIGNLLASKTKEELKQGRRWFKLLIAISLIGGVIGLVLRNDVLLFSSFFITIVTSRSLNKK